MNTISEEVKNIIKDSLEELNCCNRCILRYLGYTIFDDGRDIFLYPETHSIFNVSDDQSKSKKVKSNPCRACLDILSDSTIESYVEMLPAGFEEYGMKDFTTFVTLPISTLIRERSILIYLKEKFPDVYKDIQFSDLDNSKKILKLASSNLLADKLNKTFKTTSNFQININIVYEDEEKETQNVSKLADKKISRTAVCGTLTKCTDKLFKTQFPVPPDIQDKSTSATITYSSSFVFLGGRYLKFSREMGQTPFVVNNVAITESSVQEKLFNGITKILECDQQNLRFTASGREDADTRMIGKGRPFYVQIENPKFENVTYEQCRTIEASILQSNAVVVTNLQLVPQHAVKEIKFGEEKKKKNYRALCKTLAPNMDMVMTIINLLKGPIKINQTTPIRVLHRRSHIIRERCIFEIKASKVEGHSDLFYLDLKTQAGTYVKEFVHGDFHRTVPNITQMIGYATDVVALDVTAVELEWPLNDKIE